MAELKDSGNRREFASGAVRDMADGKGRCDLLPLDVIAILLNDDEVITCIGDFKKGGNFRFLIHAIEQSGMFPDIYTAILETAKQFEDGSKKYGDDNWKKGIPVKFYIDSGVRHYLKYKRGDIDEPHDRAFLWNMICAIWTSMNYEDLNQYTVTGNVSLLCDTGSPFKYL